MAEKENTKNLDVNLKDFSPEVLREIKRLSDANGGTREWLANVYFKDGKYILGSPVFGDYSGVSMKPDEQAVKDKLATGIKECESNGLEHATCKNIVMNGSKGGMNMYGVKNRSSFGATQEDLVTTIHMHPIKPFELPGNRKIRKQFSGTDIGSEFAKAIRNNSQEKMFLAYPESAGWGKQHTKVKLMKFPGKQSLDIMKKSNPHLSDKDIMSITPEGKGIEKVDWYSYQEESKKRGMLQEVDIEEKTGTQAYASMGNTYVGFVVVGVLVAVGIAWYVNKKKKTV